MDLNLKNKFFIVCGATSGFGLSTLKSLYAEGAEILAIARTFHNLKRLKSNYKNIEILSGDITQSQTIDKLLDKLSNRQIYGILVNSGGPAAMKFNETNMEDWDMAYKNVLRWKVEITKKLLPKMQKNDYGRFLFIESSAVKQPIENLLLSTSLRLAVVGFVKSISQEMSSSNITFNILAPGMHDTPALKRLFEKKATQNKISVPKAKELLINQLPMKKLGDPNNVGSIAAWLFSPYSSYITGQTISIDGGNMKYIFG